MSIGIPDDTEDRVMRPSAEDARILVVDEDPAFQLGLKTFLKEYVGFEKVYTAQSGSEAVERILKDDTIDVVTLDYQMHGMNGIEVLEKLRYTLKRPVSFLMVTRYPSEELEETFRKCASSVLLTSHFISKPIEFENLEPIVLQAHKEVCAAREIGVSEPTVKTKSEPTSEVLENDVSELPDRLDQQGAKLDEIERQVAGLKKSWRGDFLKLLLIGGLVFTGLQLGWFKKQKPVGQDLLESAKVIPVDTLNTAEETGGAIDAGGEEEARASHTDELSSKQDPVNEGRPL